jgi:hypothetical protein
MIATSIEIRSERARKMLRKLSKKISDMTPVWKKFIKFYQDDVIKKTWDTQGKMMEGTSWAPLVPQYEKWKTKNSGKRMMELSGDLLNAATGGAGWVERIKKKELTIGVTGKEYFKQVQERGKNPRRYFTTKEDDIPNRAYIFLLKEMDNHIEKAKGGK